MAGSARLVLACRMVVPPKNWEDTMRCRSRSASLAAALLVAACASNPTPVPVRGSPEDLAVLRGEWQGEYLGTQSGRTGSISFSMTSNADIAYGEVLMIPRGWDHPVNREDPRLRGGVPSAPETLTISFVTVAGQQLSGRLDPYRDPACDCRASTVFVGRVRGDTLEGRFTTRFESGLSTRTGTWRVVRRAGGSG
jgi:hypothetical protein